MSHFSFQDKYLRPKLDLLICDPHTNPTGHMEGQTGALLNLFMYQKQKSPFQEVEQTELQKYSSMQVHNYILSH